MRAFTGECIAYRAEIENLHGNWRGAIDEAAPVCDPAAGYEDAAVAAASYQVGDALRMLGELDAAEGAYRTADRLGRDPQPGLALLRLAQGQPAAAAAALQRALAERRDPLQRARLLPALCEILLELGDAEASLHTCAELEEIARRIPADALTTMAARVRGAALLAAGQAPDALPLLRTALRSWQELGAPYEAARVRLLLAEACRAVGDDEGAALELDEARAAFTTLGAAVEVARIDARRAVGASPLPGGLTAREAQVLALIATGRSNRAAAAHLGISEKTIARHLSNIYGKLGISSRAAATAYAYEHDLHLPSA
jgi:DNA-binding CsgD family transcriptional regulator